MATLAICIPAYNAENYLPRLLQSAKDQLVPFDEILVYNDCSTDNTAEVAARFGAKVLNGTVNKGCSFGKNQLATATRCDWIHFHDADDELLPNFTTLAHKWINSGACPDVVLFNYEYRDNETNELLGIRKFDKATLETNAIAYAIQEQINPFCGLYNKAKFIEAGGYDTDPLVLYNEDSAFHIKMAIGGLKFSAEPEISIINYRISNSMSASNFNKCLEAQYHVLKKTASVKPEFGLQIANRLWPLIGNLAAVKNWKYVKKALLLSKTLGYTAPPEDKGVFKFMAQLNPLFAIWFREKMIRLFKPSLRKNG